MVHSRVFNFKVFLLTFLESCIHVDVYPGHLQFGLIWMRETRCAVEEAANGGKTTDLAGQVIDTLTSVLINVSFGVTLLFPDRRRLRLHRSLPPPWISSSTVSSPSSMGTCKPAYNLESGSGSGSKIRIKDQKSSPPSTGTYVTSLENLQAIVATAVAAKIIFAKTDKKERSAILA